MFLIFIVKMDQPAAKIALCESILGYEFSEKRLCLEAIQAGGDMIIWDLNWQHIPKNDRLAVLGDILFKFELCKKWLDTGRSKGASFGACVAWSANTSDRSMEHRHPAD